MARDARFLWGDLRLSEQKPLARGRPPIRSRQAARGLGAVQGGRRALNGRKWRVEQGSTRMSGARRSQLTQRASSRSGPFLHPASELFPRRLCRTQRSSPLECECKKWLHRSGGTYMHFLCEGGGLSKHSWSPQGSYRKTAPTESNLHLVSSSCRNVHQLLWCKG